MPVTLKPTVMLARGRAFLMLTIGEGRLYCLQSDNRPWPRTRDQRARQARIGSRKGTGESRRPGTPPAAETKWALNPRTGATYGTNCPRCDP
jgi:hypothetical protein